MSVKLRCPRCKVVTSSGECVSERVSERVKCKVCRLVIPISCVQTERVSECVSDGVCKGVSEEVSECESERVSNRVLWQLNEGNSSAFTPYTYTHSLVHVPGITAPVMMNRRITQAVCECVRERFIPRHLDVWLVTYPKSGTSECVCVCVCVCV